MIDSVRSPLALLLTFSTHNNSKEQQNNDKMNGERGLQAAVGVVMAFSILWTMAILVPDDSSSSASVTSTQKFGGLVVDGKHYVLDTNVDQTNSDGVYKVIHAVKTPTNAKKSPKNIKRVSAYIDSCYHCVRQDSDFLTHLMRCIEAK